MKYEMHTFESAGNGTIQAHQRDETSAVMAIHCSGSDQSQWAHLNELLDARFSLLRPDLAGPEADAAGWSMTTYSLAEEARPLVALLRQQSGPTHLVGHSYGGAVALHIARVHPELVASLCLYEPTMFSLLNRASVDDVVLFDDIKSLAHSIRDAVAEGYPDFAAQVFADFWGGMGSWQALRRDRRTSLTNWISKCPLDFGALLFEPADGILQISQPTTLIAGMQTHRHTRRICELLKKELPDARFVEVEGAGHLGPFIFRDKVGDLVEEHLSRIETAYPVAKV